MKKQNKKTKGGLSLLSSNYLSNNKNNNLRKKLNNLTTINNNKEKKILSHKRSKSSYKSQSSRPTLLNFLTNNLNNINNNNSSKSTITYSTNPNYNTSNNFFIKLNRSLSPQLIYSKNNYLLPPKTTDKKTLVLDLDETLVHSSFIPFPIPSDLIIQIELENEIHDIHILIRPYVKEFLEKMSKRFEIVIFTASISKYANPLLDLIDKNKYCTYRLFREHCTLINTAFVKDLNRLGRNLKDVIIVDNTPAAYALNQYNGFPIKSWFDDKNDFELIKIIPILEFLSYVNDIRVYIKKIVSQNQIKFDCISKVISDYHKSLKNSSMIIFNRKKDLKTLLSKSKSTRENILKKINDNSSNFESNFGKLKLKKKQLSITNSNFLKKNNNFFTMNTMRNNSSKKNIILITFDKNYISTENLEKNNNNHNNNNEKNSLIEINNKKKKPTLNINYLKNFLKKKKISKGKNSQITNKSTKNS